MRINIFLMAALLFFSSCNEGGGDSNLLVVGTSADNPPYEFIQDSTIIGMDIDIAEAIAKEMGRKLVIKNLDFPGLLPALVSKNVDIVIAAINPTPERQQRVDFSDHYATTTMAILYHSDRPLKDTSELADKIIGVQTGTTWESYVNDMHDNWKYEKVRSLSNNMILVEELKSGTIDAVVLEIMQANKFASKVSGTVVLELPNTKANFAIALPKDSALTGQINKIIVKLQQDGTISKLQAKW